jgi:hypothetical protein
MTYKFLCSWFDHSLHHCVQNGSVAHPASYPMGTGALSLGVKRPGREADHSPPSSAELKEWVELCLHSPNMPPWRGAHLKHRDNFTFTLIIFCEAYKLWSSSLCSLLHSPATSSLLRLIFSSAVGTQKPSVCVLHLIRQKNNTRQELWMCVDGSKAVKSSVKLLLKPVTKGECSERLSIERRYGPISNNGEGRVEDLYVCSKYRCIFLNTRSRINK